MMSALRSGTLLRYGRPAVGVTMVLMSSRYAFKDFPRRGRMPIILGMRKGSHGAGRWALPGGHMDFVVKSTNELICESAAETAIRETGEETGCRVIYISAPLAAERTFVAAPGKNYQDLFVYGVTDDEPEIVEPDKIEPIDCAHAGCACAELGAAPRRGWHLFDPALLPYPLFGPTTEAVTAFEDLVQAFPFPGGELDKRFKVRPC
jgi:ADP-ribose pyrophosphatase YjhB (NUDIX family)